MILTTAAMAVLDSGAKPSEKASEGSVGAMAGRLFVLVPVTDSVGTMSSIVAVGRSSSESSSSSVGEAVCKYGGTVRKASEPERKTDSGRVTVSKLVGSESAIAAIVEDEEEDEVEDDDGASAVDGAGAGAAACVVVDGTGAGAAMETGAIETSATEGTAVDIAGAGTTGVETPPTSASMAGGGGAAAGVGPGPGPGKASSSLEGESGPVSVSVPTSWLTPGSPMSGSERSSRPGRESCRRTCLRLRTPIVSRRTGRPLVILSTGVVW